MIQLKRLFTPVASLDAEEARAYLARQPEGTYTLLDVRQPGEYQEEHLPGAKLVPLPQLAEAYQELDPEQPTLVYCAIGGRSRVAAQMLSGLGFKEVYNLAGGIKAYRGGKATGPVALNLDLIRGDETPAELLVLAYGMEMGLKTFYETLATKTSDQELKSLFSKLARIEEQHQQRLFDLYAPLDPGKDRAALEAGAVAKVLEGGWEMEAFLQENAPHLHTVPQVLELALMLETQALDLYLRFAQRSREAATREVLHTIAGEEKAHLASLGRLLEEHLGRQG